MPITIGEISAGVGLAAKGYDYYQAGQKEYEIDIIHNSIESTLIDKFEELIVSNFESIECPITHHFTAGIYAREMFAPAGSFLTSKIHKQEHLFCLSKGKLKVWDEVGGEIILSAPYFGITEAGTRRAAEVVEDVIWTTFHAISFITGEERFLSECEQEKIVDDIEKIVIIPHENLLLLQDKSTNSLKEKEEIICHGFQ